MYAYAIHDAFRNPSVTAVPRLVETLSATEITSDNAKDSLTIVYVIGESFSRNRSSLYGYPYPTNPLLAKEQADSSLIIFNNVISIAFVTSVVYPTMLSTIDTQGDLPFEEYPLLPALLKKAGYKVAYYDNQTPISEGKHDFTTSYFLNFEKVRSFCFDDFNTEKINDEFDADFVNRHLPLTARDESPTLTIYHLMGQHMYYKYS